MAKLTRAEIKDYIRSITGEMDSDRINSLTLDEDINLSQRRIQLDFIGEGLKQFTKIALANGYFVPAPSDMIFHPNAIIDIEAATGVQATINLTAGTVGFDGVIKAIEPGVTGNDWTVVLFNSAGSPPTLTEYDIDAKTLSITAESGVTTIEELVAFFGTDPIISNFFTISTNDSGVWEYSGQSLVSSGGSGNGWKPAEERSIERFNRARQLTFQRGTDSEPMYRRLGNTSGAQTLEFYPQTIKCVKTYYHYLLADLTEDTDTSALPLELEGLLLTEIQRRVYIYLKQQTSSDSEKLEYQKQVADFEEKYQKGLAIARNDNTRLETADNVA